MINFGGGLGTPDIGLEGLIGLTYNQVLTEPALLTSFVFDEEQNKQYRQDQRQKAMWEQSAKKEADEKTDRGMKETRKLLDGGGGNNNIHGDNPLSREDTFIDSQGRVCVRPKEPNK